MTGWQFLGLMVLIGWVGMWGMAWIKTWRDP